jgi:hypothetical protein
MLLLLLTAVLPLLPLQLLVVPLWRLLLVVG